MFCPYCFSIKYKNVRIPGKLNLFQHIWIGVYTRPGVAGEVIIGCMFCLQVDWPITEMGGGGRGGRGISERAYKQWLMVH